MLKRYIEIEDHIANLGIEELDDVLLTNDEEIVVERLLKKLEDLGSVTVAFQSDSSSLRDARALLDAIQGTFPSLESITGLKAPVLEHPSFQSVWCN